MVEWNGTVVLTTPRLVLRTFPRDDLPLYAALNADFEVARHLGGPLSRKDSGGIAEWAQECYAREGLGLLAVERRRDGAFLPVAVRLPLRGPWHGVRLSRWRPWRRLRWRRCRP
jgi:RimJ/RimL family protein N-acetyltransferase